MEVSAEILVQSSYTHKRSCTPSVDFKSGARVGNVCGSVLNSRVTCGCTHTHRVYAAGTLWDAMRLERHCGENNREVSIIAVGAHCLQIRVAGGERAPK